MVGIETGFARRGPWHGPPDEIAKTHKQKDNENETAIPRLRVIRNG